MAQKEKVTWRQNCYFLWGPNWPQKWVSWVHIVHIFESSSNEHIKQDWMNPEEIRRQKSRKPEFWFIARA